MSILDVLELGGSRAPGCRVNQLVHCRVSKSALGSALIQSARSMPLHDKGRRSITDLPVSQTPTALMVMLRRVRPRYVRQYYGYSS